MPVQIPEPQAVNQTILRNLPQDGARSKFFNIFVAIIVVLGGVGTGWMLSGARVNFGGSKTPTSTGVKVNQNEAGISDVSKYKDVTGLLEEGGVNNEGTHHLTRDGGPSQTVVLASTVIDLQSFVGKKVQVWGDTQASKKAAWFMDVVKIKVIQ
jgi:hypothetical protein